MQQHITEAYSEASKESSVLKQGASSLVSNLSGNETALGVGIGAAVLVSAATLALFAERNAMSHHARAGFKFECDNNIASYRLRSDADSDVDRFFANFIKLLSDIGEDGFSFLTYSGIHQDKNTADGTTYYVSAEYGAGELFDEVESEDETLDRARLAIDTFLNAATEIPPLLAAVKKKLKSDLLGGAKLLIHGEAHYKESRLTRFVTFAVLNIMEKAKNPRDLKTKILFSANKSKAFCDAFVARLSTLTNIRQDFDLLSTSRSCGDNLRKVLMNLQLYTQMLAVAFEKNALHQVALTEIISCAEKEQQSMLKTIFSLIYDPIYDEKREKNILSNPEHLICLINELHTQIMQNDGLIKAMNFPIYSTADAERMMLNKSPVTIIDLLILLCRTDSRLTLIKDLKKNAKGVQDQLDFAIRLEDFHIHFIKPLEKIIPKRDLFATYIIPWVTFALSIHQKHVILDEQVVIDSMSSHEQVRKINKLVQMGASISNPYYERALLKELGLDKKTYSLFEPVVDGQYGLMEVTLLLDRLNYFRQQNRQIFFDYKVLAVLIEVIRMEQLTYHEVVRSINLLYVHINGKHGSPGLQRHILTVMGGFIPLITAAFDESVTSSLSLLISSRYLQAEGKSMAENIQLIESLSTELMGPSDKLEACFVSLQSSIGASLQNGGSSGGSTTPAPAAPTPMPLTSLSTSAASTVLPSASLTASPSAASVVQAHSPLGDSSHTEVSSSFMLKTFCALSAGCLVLGVLVVLSLTYGTPYLDIIKNLAPNTSSVMLLGGYVSAVSGGIGLASSYLIPKFFDRTLEKKEPAVAAPMVPVLA